MYPPINKQPAYNELESTYPNSEIVGKMDSGYRLHINLQMKTLEEYAKN